MAENPNNNDYMGLGPQTKVPNTNMDSRYLIPSNGMLRFVKRNVPTENPDVMEKTCILQEYGYSQILGESDWFDVPLVEDET